MTSPWDRSVSGNEPAAHERYEIHRDDLLDILSGAVKDEVEILFGQSIVELDEGTDGVSVSFSNGDRRDYALVFGCDGNRSNTRKLVFGEGEQFAYFMGGYFFLKVVPHIGLLPANMSQVYSVPGVWRC